MTPDFPRTPLALAWAGVSLFILLWDVALAGQIAQARRQARDFLAMTALCGLFVLPGAVVALAGTSAGTGRTITSVDWIWPATLGLFVIQGGLAFTRGLVTSLLSIPTFVFNVVLFVAAVARYATATWPAAPATLLGVQVAQASTLGLVLGQAALASPFAVPMPLLAPAYPARWKVSKTLRAALAIGAAAWTLLVVAEYPSGVRAVASFGALTNEPMQERPRGDLVLGVRILPDLAGPPPAAALAPDLALADSLGVGTLAVVVTPAGANGAALDSLDAVLAPWRADSVQVMVSLGYGPDDAADLARSPDRYRDRRLAALDQVVRRLRPDVLVPAVDPTGSGRQATGAPLAWWIDYHARAARLAHTLRPRTAVAAVAATFGTEDSLFYAWAARHDGIDVLGLSFAPTFRGGGAMAARQRVAARWMATNRKPHVVTSVRAYPYTFGEAAQRSALVGTFAWASRQPRVRTVVADGSGDYAQLTGLARADGAWRPAVVALARARQALEETAR